MNITMNRAELLHAVKRAAAVAPANSPLEALKGVLVEVSAASKSLVLTATNLEVTLKQKLACAAPEDDALAIDARLLAGMLEKLPGNTVELRRKPGDSRLAVWSGGAKYNVSIWERGGYPKAEIPAVTNLVRISGIPSMAKRTVFAADENNEKPMLKCVQFRVTQDGLRAAGSDGTCVVTASGDDKSTGEFSVLIPAPSLSRLAQMCEDKDEFRAGVNGKNIVFVREGFLFSARLIQEKYIDTDFLTSSLKNQFTVLTDVAELRRALDNVSCVEPDGKVQLSFEGMTLSFRCGGVHGSAQNGCYSGSADRNAPGGVLVSHQAAEQLPAVPVRDGCFGDRRRRDADAGYRARLLHAGRCAAWSATVRSPKRGQETGCREESGVGGGHR